jgi:parallel beta-helix repeat protein
MITYMRYEYILVLIIIFVSISDISNATPSLVSDDNINWTHVSDNNYSNYDIFTRNVKCFYKAKVDISNLNINDSNFIWKVDKLDDYTDFKLFINDQHFDTCKSTDFVNISPFIYDENSKYQFEIYIRKSGGQRRVWVAFPKQIPTHKLTDIFLGQNLGFNDTSYTFSARFGNLSENEANYVFDWGDGTNSVGSISITNRIANASHSWNREGVFAVKVKASNRSGNELETQIGKIKILWQAILSPLNFKEAMKKVQNNTTIFLKDGRYYGQFEIEALDNVTIRPLSEMDKVEIIAGRCNYAIGAQNAKNLSISNISLIGGNYSAYLNNCVYCTISNNLIQFNDHGIHITGGTRNEIRNNQIIHVNESSISSAYSLVGLFLEKTKDVNIYGNYISGISDQDRLYSIQDSSWNRFNLHPLTDGLIVNNDCCCHCDGIRWGDCEFLTSKQECNISRVFRK